MTSSARSLRVQENHSGSAKNVLKALHAEVRYKTTAYWSREHERCIAWNDADIGIGGRWIPGPVLSPRDAEGTAFTRAELF